MLPDYFPFSLFDISSYKMGDFIYMFFYLWLLQTLIPIFCFLFGLTVNTAFRKLVPGDNEIPFLPGDASW